MNVDVVLATHIMRISLLRPVLLGTLKGLHIRSDLLALQRVHVYSMSRDPKGPG